MILCAAQVRPVPGDVDANIAAHLRWIDLAAESGVDLILFPELSLSGYEPRLAKALTMDADDPRLDAFQTAGDRHAMCIAVGAPLQHDGGVGIGMVIFQPHRTRQTYLKQMLHADELPFFTAGSTPVTLHLHGHALVPAICYESLQTPHAEAAARSGASVYLASVAKSVAGVARARMHYPEMARRFGLTVLMANCVGPCDDFVAAGGSAAWAADGLLAGPLTETEEGLVVVDRE